MKIKVFSRAECFAAAHGWGIEYGIADFDVPTLIISISSYDTSIPNALAIDAKKKPDIIKHVEYCQFDDIDYKEPVKGLIPMRDVDAQRIIRAVEQWKDKVDQIVVHCDAGYSRSPAVAAALALALNGRGADDEFFVKGNYCPNMHVYNTMLKELDARGYFNDL